MSTLEQVLVLVDPVSCGVAALERALTELDPSRHEPTLLVVAKAPPGGASDDPNHSAEFAHADAALATYRRMLAEAGFTVEGWVTPDRREQMTREIEAAGRYARALAVSPSGAWRRLVKRDVTQVLETVGIDTELRCSR